MCKSILSVLLACWLGAWPGVAAPQVSFQNSPRVHELMRAGNLYLSLQDALALAIENNLDIELERYLMPQGDAELLRAQGGGTDRHCVAYARPELHPRSPHRYGRDFASPQDP